MISVIQYLLNQIDPLLTLTLPAMVPLTEDQMILPPDHVLDSDFSWVDMECPSDDHFQARTLISKRIDELEGGVLVKRMVLGMDLRRGLLGIVTEPSRISECSRLIKLIAIKSISFMDGTNQNRLHDIGYFYQRVSYLSSFVFVLILIIILIVSPSR